MLISLARQTFLLDPNISFISFVVFRILLGDSKKIEVPDEYLSFSKKLILSESLVGTKPKKVNESAGSPEADSAAIGDDGPGIGTTFIFSS